MGGIKCARRFHLLLLLLLSSGRVTNGHEKTRIEKRNIRPDWEGHSCFTFHLLHALAAAQCCMRGVYLSHLTVAPLIARNQYNYYYCLKRISKVRKENTINTTHFLKGTGQGHRFTFHSISVLYPACINFLSLSLTYICEFFVCNYHCLPASPNSVTFEERENNNHLLIYDSLTVEFAFFSSREKKKKLRHDLTHTLGHDK